MQGLQECHTPALHLLSFIKTIPRWNNRAMGCFKWFLILLLVLALLAGIAFLVVKFGAVALWTLFGLLLVAGILLAMMGKG